MELYQNESACQTPLDRQYHADVKALNRSKGRRNSRIFTYTDHDRYTNCQPFNQSVSIWRLSVHEWISAAMAIFDLWSSPQFFESWPRWSSWLTNKWETWCWKLNNQCLSKCLFLLLNSTLLIYWTQANPVLHFWLRGWPTCGRDGKNGAPCECIHSSSLLFVCWENRSHLNLMNSFSDSILKITSYWIKYFFIFFLGISIFQGWRSSTGSPQRSLWRAATWSIAQCRPCTSWEIWVPLEGGKHAVHHVTTMFV